LYEAGSTRDVHFDKPGISYIFCNIHPEMSAVVVALTRHYGISTGRLITGVPMGKYVLRMCMVGPTGSFEGDDTGSHDNGHQLYAGSAATGRE
jgi:hypothetical protein